MPTRLVNEAPHLRRSARGSADVRIGGESRAYRDSALYGCHDRAVQLRGRMAPAKRGGTNMLSRAMAALQQRLKRRKLGRRQTSLLARGPAPDPRLPQQSLDPNAGFIGEQMGQGGEG